VAPCTHASRVMAQAMIAYSVRSMVDGAAPASCRNGPVERRRKRYRVIGNGQSARSGETHAPALSGGAEHGWADPRLSSAQMRMIAMGYVEKPRTRESVSA